MDTHEPQFDPAWEGSPIAVHDMACAVCHESAAVLNLSTGVFAPCWGCQEAGWSAPKHGWRKRIDQ